MGGYLETHVLDRLHAVLVSFIAVIRQHDYGNLQNKEFIEVYSSESVTIMM